jgi:predicted DNA-binding transcriptional regulator AlpA
MNPIDDTRATAAYIGKPERTLGQWRYLGRGPAYIKLENGSIRYRKADVDAWLEGQVVRPREVA